MILLYRGKSFVSWRIKLATLSPYSHAAWLKSSDDDRRGLRDLSHHHREQWNDVAKDIIGLGCIEAWHIGGVRETDSLRSGHKSGTIIDIFDPVGVEEFKFSMVEDRLRSRVGESYWFSGILWARLNKYRDKEAPEGEWFCSHLIEEALRFYECPTTDTRVPAHGVWPGCFERSVLTSYLGSVKV
jgi:hypothetical protein